RHFPVQLADGVLVVCMLVTFGEKFWAQSNEVLGEIELVGATKVEKTSGVWVDGQYLGYLKELKGSKKILLLPGQHEIVVRQDGYQDFTNNITVRPGERQTISVKMVKDLRFKMPSVFSEIKLSVTPDRAAVFVDGQFVGHAGEVGGVAKSLLIAPGHRKITISLPGYQTFSTEVDLAPNQKFQIKTDLMKEGTSPSSPE
ncbi:MAG TPA: PEGA domain-containing protein, partial [Terriglobales bacterium]|nr:PEGA domain-containing protein [Terriglobales bacterium]